MTGRLSRVPRIHSFAPIARADAQVLILGSMPGEASLAAGRYYAHPRNSFWPVLGTLCGFPADAPYERRVAALQRGGIALWDVLRSCERAGSLDGDIVAATAEANDFAAFFAAHSRIRAVFCNGGSAFRAFLRVARSLDDPFRSLPCRALPSTSPAHAGRTTSWKREVWRLALAPFLRA